MNNIANVLTVLLVVVLGVSASFDFAGSEKVTAITDRLQIPRRAVPVLGAIKALTAVALVLGTRQIRIAEASGAFLVGYFAVALVTHVRVRDGVRNSAPAFVLLVVSGLYLLATFAR